MLAGPTVVITDSDLDSDDDEQVLREAGFATVRLRARTEAEVIAGLAQAGADALIVQWAPVSAVTLDAAPRCRFISRLGIGYDMIDVAAATERGVAVANTPHYCVDEVGAHPPAMALLLLRGPRRFDAARAGGGWGGGGPGWLGAGPRPRHSPAAAAAERAPRPAPRWAPGGRPPGAAGGGAPPGRRLPHRPPGAADRQPRVPPPSPRPPR